MVDKMEKVWLDGKLIPWDEANVHILTHALHYGLGVFEGIRCYKHANGKSSIFRLEEHIERLFESAHILTMDMPYTKQQIIDACLETVRANKAEECYLRPIAFAGDGAMGLGAVNPTRVSIITWKWGSYLGDEGIKNGIRAKISSFTRPGVNMLMAKGKVVGHYVNSVLAKREAQKAGYQESILLDAQGYVSEASGENIFVVRKGKIITPSMGSSILGGITRDSIIAICKDLGFEVIERNIARDELYIADEVFFCGTAAEVTPVREIDDRKIGTGGRGPITEKVQSRYFDIVRGKHESHSEWHAYV